MLLKLLWFLVILWIIQRVIRAGRNLIHIAAGRTGQPVPPPGYGAGHDAGPAAHAPRAAPTEASGPPARKRLDIEDARFEDL